MLELQFEITKLRNDLEVEHSNHMDKLDVITDLKKKIAVKDRDIKMKDDSISSLEHLKKEKNDKIALLDREIKNLNEIV